MSENDLLRAVQKVGKSPCLKYWCAQQENCAAQKLACDAFYYFADTGRVVDPRHLMPLYGKPSTWIMQEQPTPNEEIFESMLIESDYSFEGREKLLNEIHTSAFKSQIDLQLIWGR